MPAGALGPVGAVAGDRRGPGCTATVVAQNTDVPEWEYGPEIGIHVIPNSCQELPIDDERLLFWSGIEVSVNSRELRALMGLGPRQHKPDNDGWFVVASLARRDQPRQPLGWAACAPLRGKFDEKEARLAAIRKSWEEGKQLRDLKLDPFLQSGDKYVARLNDPMRVHAGNGTTLGDGLVLGRAPKGLDETVWHFGICSRACLEAFGLGWTVEPPPESYAVREADANGQFVVLPQVAPRKLEHAVAWHALAGRDRDEDITIRAMMEQTQKALEGGAEWE